MSDRATLAIGAALGLGAALAWGVYNTGSREGALQGFRPADLTLLRFALGGLLLAPLTWARRARLPGPGRLAVIVALIGPAFALLINLGYQHAPLAHGVVISPGVSMIVTALWSLRGARRAEPRQLAALALMLVALLVIGRDRAAVAGPPGDVRLGDLCFVVTGIAWGTYVHLAQAWRLDPVASTGALTLASAAVFAPIYFAVWGAPPPLPAVQWGLQAVYQGVLGGSLALVLFAGAVARLGSARASLFSALVPISAALVAAPITGHPPSAVQWAGIALASAAMVVALDLRRRVPG